MLELAKEGKLQFNARETIVVQLIEGLVSAQNIVDSNPFVKHIILLLSTALILENAPTWLKNIDWDI